MKEKKRTPFVFSHMYSRRKYTKYARAGIYDWTRNVLYWTVCLWVPFSLADFVIQTNIIDEYKLSSVMLFNFAYTSNVTEDIWIYFLVVLELTSRFLERTTSSWN